MTDPRSSQRLRPDARHRRGVAADSVAVGKQGVKLDGSARDSLVRNINAAFQHHLFNSAQPQV